MIAGWIEAMQKAAIAAANAKSPASPQSVPARSIAGSAALACEIDSAYRASFSGVTS